MNNYAFIDANNLYIAIKELGWKIDYKKLRIYLKEHYEIEKAYMFMGYKPKEQKMYEFLKKADYFLIFKPVLELENNTVKGNCDAELVLQAMIEFQNYKKALIIIGDGDFYCLIKYLNKNQKLLKVLAPSGKNCSFLIRKIVKNNLGLVSDLRTKIEYKKRRGPRSDETEKDTLPSCLRTE